MASGDNTETVNLDGSLTIRRAAEVREILSGHLGGSADLIVDLSRGEDFDLTILQMLAAADQSLRARGRKLALLEGCPDRFERLLENTGFSALLQRVDRTATAAALEEGKSDG